MTDYALRLDDTTVSRFAAAARLAERAERDQWADAGVTAGASVADVGCGPAAVTVLLAQRVAPGGRVVGIDSDPAALAAARRLAGDAANVSFGPGDAASTELAPGNDVSAGLGLAGEIRRAGLELTGFRGRYDIFREKGFRGPAWEAREAMSSAGFARPADLVSWQEAFDRIDRGEEPPPCSSRSSRPSAAYLANLAYPWARAAGVSTSPTASTSSDIS